MTAAALLALLVQAPQQDLQVSGHAGFGGVVERGEWTPLTIDLDNRGKDDLDLVLTVTWGQSSAVQDSDKPTLGSLYGKTGPLHTLGVSLAPRSRKRLSLSLRAPEVDRLNPWVFADNVKTGRGLAAVELLARSLPGQKRLAVVVGAELVDGLDGYLSTQAAPEHLPEDWRAYAAVDTLFWLDAKASELRSQAQADALRTWIEFGGRFIVARSTDLGLTGSPIADLVPVVTKGSRPVAGLPALAEADAGAPPSGQALVLDSTPRGGRVRLAQDGIPLVVDAPLGAGRSIFVAFDPSKAPFHGWGGASRFWAWLSPVVRTSSGSPSEGERPPASIGSMTLALVAGQFPDVEPPAIGGLFVLIVIYLVVVGPFDYLVLRKFRRLELTWITFPTYVILFTLLILFAGGAFIERAAYQREILVIDRAAGAAQERRLALSAVLAPRNQRYALQDVEPISANYLASQLGSLDLGNPVLLRTPEARLKEWTVSRGATGLVAADRAVPAKGPLTWTLVGDGKISVKNDTGAPLRSAVLITDAAVYDVDPIPAGASEVAIHRKHPSLAAFLRAQGANTPEPVPEDDSGVNPRYYGERPPQRSIAEAALDSSVRRTLLTLSFGTSPRGGSGFARSLDASCFLHDGGSILLVWDKPAAAEVKFDPLPGRFTGLAMIRYFQGPSK